MPFLYIYSPSDFTTTPPSENATAVGTSPFTLTLVAGATPTVIEVSDNDAVFDEVDASQVLANAVNLDGTTYAAGTTVHSSYDLINATTGHKVTSIHFGGDGHQGGPVHGIISSIDLVPGTSYTFTINRTSNHQPNNYAGYVACFVNGTLIETARGAVPVEDLQPGDRLRTIDGSFKPLRLIPNRALGPQDLAASPKLRPIRILAGALGVGNPQRDLLVSPQHRMLVKSTIAERMFGVDEVLVAATKLTVLPGIFVDETVEEFSYFHLVLDAHEVIFAEGALTESFYCGPFAIQALAPETRAEMEELFPGLLTQEEEVTPARPIPAGPHQRKLLARHLKNAMPVAAVPKPQPH